MINIREDGLIREFLNHINSINTDYNNWYVGITERVDDVIGSVHLKEENVSLFYRSVDNVITALYVKEFLMKIGLAGSNHQFVPAADVVYVIRLKP